MYILHLALKIVMFSWRHPYNWKYTTHCSEGIKETSQPQKIWWSSSMLPEIYYWTVRHTHKERQTDRQMLITYSAHYQPASSALQAVLDVGTRCCTWRDLSGLCVCLCVLVILVSLAKMAELMKMTFDGRPIWAKGTVVVVVVVVEMNIIKVALSHCCCKTTVQY